MSSKHDSTIIVSHDSRKSVTKAKQMPASPRETTNPTVNRRSARLAQAAMSRPKRKLEHGAKDAPAHVAKRLKVILPGASVVPSVKKNVAKRGKSVPVKIPRARNVEIILTHAPTQRLDVYVFGGNSAGELGLGQDARSENVTKPYLNHNLAADSVGVAQIATGGMHCAALTCDNKILTWGVNDLGALGRDTAWDGGLVDVKEGDEQSDSGSDGRSGLNPRESTPGQIDMSEIPEHTVFTQVAAGDNSTFAITNTGLVYGWGTFRRGDGHSNFSPTQEYQRLPTVIPGVKGVTKIAAGENHVVALTSNGSVFIWGSGEQSQLGRRVLERRKLQALVPWQIKNLKNVVNIGTGSNHSFAIHQNGTVYSWGLNNYGQTGIPDNAGEDEAVTHAPSVIKSLRSHGKVRCITGGNHHSIAVTKDGECLVWGRLDSFATGLDLDSLQDENVIRDLRDRQKILAVPTQIPGLDAALAAAGSDHCIAITKDYRAFSWGFNVDGQTGQGGDGDVERATLIDDETVRGKKLAWAGAGGQYSILAGERIEITEGK